MTAYKEQEILQWAHDKGILGENGKGTIIGQTRKMMEEHSEVVGAILEGDKDNLQCEIGDLYVTSVILASMHSLCMSDCISSAVNKITQRTGVMLNGQFVRDKV